MLGCFGYLKMFSFTEEVNDLILASFHLDHGWYFAKLDIVNILVLDYFGGANEVTVEDYYKATPY